MAMYVILSSVLYNGSVRAYFIQMEAGAMFYGYAHLSAVTRSPSILVR